MKCGECPVATTNPKDKMDCYFCPFDKVDAFHSLHDCSHLSELVERMAELLKEREEFGEELNNAVELVRKKDEKVKELLKEQEWIPISERLPENAEHPGAFCPKVRVLTVWGESYGWYNPDVKAWYFLEWYTDCSRNHLDFERGDYPGICYTPWNTNLITHWKPIP